MTIFIIATSVIFLALAVPFVILNATAKIIDRISAEQKRRDDLWQK
jgi:hypothetical protein